VIRRRLVQVIALTVVAACVSIGLSISAKTVNAACDPAKAACAFAPLPEPKPSTIDLAEISKIDLDALPLVPKITDQVQLIYQQGVKNGNNIHVFSKVGDCMTATDDFMKPYAGTDYSLGAYTSLDKVIKFFANVPVSKDSKLDSFGNPGLADTSGFNAASVLDPMWSDPKVCKADDGPLSCEYGTSKPGIALIMFGTNDMKSIKPEQFDFYLRRVVVQTVNAGIIPILSTFPVQPGLEKESVLYNQITAKIAADYDLPLINLYLGLKPLEHHGVDPVVTTHMTKPESGKSGDLTEDGLKYGFNTRNLLTLQALEAVLQGLKPSPLQ
jgi:hypothetical protein